MLFREKTVCLKDDRTAILRSPVPEDSAALLECLKTTAGETEFLLRYPEESLSDVAAEEAFLRNICQSETNLMLLCELDGKLVGNCHLWYTPLQKLRHRGEVALALVKGCWGLGIGSAMLRELVAQAKEWGLEYLSLSYIEGNDRGRGLYEKLGFQEVARIPDAYRLKDGSLRADVWMMKKL